VRPLSEASITVSMNIVRSLFNYLVDNEYLVGNPLSKLKVNRKKNLSGRQVKPKITKYFDSTDQEIIWITLNSYPLKTEKERQEYERIRWMIIFLYGTALRISELVSHTMGSIQSIGGNQWVMQVLGKGGKEGTIPMSEEVMHALGRYRNSIGKGKLPSPGEDTPLLPNLNGMKSISERRANQILKSLLTRAAKLVETNEPHRADKFRLGSPHWFRHTSITDLLLRTKNIIAAKEFARHSSVDTTANIYTHIGHADRIASLKGHRFTSS
jgi:integrase/recombinase XerC